MNKLNVCLMNDSFPPTIDGVANAVTNYAQIITANHANATVVTPFYPDANDEAFDFPVLRYPSIDMTKMVGYRAGMPFSPELTRQLEKADFDIIHSHCPISSTMLARTVRDRINVPLVFTYHTKFDIDIANAVRSKLLREEATKLLVANISACDEVWTVSSGAGENLKKLGFQGDYIVMPNGVDLPRGRVDDTLIATVTADYDLPEGVPVFLFVGRMMWYKGIRIILDALSELKADGTEFRMVFVGGGNDKDEIESYSASLGLDDVVFFSAPIRDRNLIRAWYCRADLFLFPSTFDTNGLVVREAAACALASVLIAGSCAAEDVTDGRNGFLIEENSKAMAAMLRQLCHNTEKIASVGENAQSDLYMSWEEAVDRAYQRYGVVIDNYKSGLYPAHESSSDELLHTTAQALSMLGTGREHRQSLRSEMLGDINEVYSGLKEESRKMKEKLWELYQNMDRFM